jgi:hypothetical protein
MTNEQQKAELWRRAAAKVASEIVNSGTGDRNDNKGILGLFFLAPFQHRRALAYSSSVRERA